MTTWPGTRKLITITARETEDGDLTDATITATVDTPGAGPVAVTPITHVSTGVYTCAVDCPDTGWYYLRVEAAGAIVTASETRWHVARSLTDWDAS